MEKEKLFIKLFTELNDAELKLFRNNFTNYNNYSKTNLIQELCNKYSEKEIYQILSKLKKKDKEEKDQYLKEVNEIITDLNFNVLCTRFHHTGSKDDFAYYIINNFSRNKFYQILNESHKELLAIKLSNDDESLELLSNSVYRGSRSKEEYIKYICDNYSEYEIYQKISQNRIEKQEKEKVLKDLSVLTDNQLEALYKIYPKFNNSKEKLINYLYNAYSVKQIYSLLDEVQEQLNNKMDENLLKQSLTSERMELICLLDSSYKDEKYQQMIDMLIWNYDKNQIIGILNELDDITTELNEIKKQKDLEGFCILGFVDIWYYYIDSTGEFKRFYAFSHEELKIKALSKDLPVYKNFKNKISSSSKFSNKIRSKINVTIITPHEKYYNLFSKDFNSEDLKKEVIAHLGSYYPEKNSDTIFKIIVPKSSLNDKTIICPNCGVRIPKKAVRCKHCKTMMKDLLMMIDSELELYGLNPEELELV